MPYVDYSRLFAIHYKLSKINERNVIKTLGNCEPLQSAGNTGRYGSIVSTATRKAKGQP
jgi:hypothetical protein